MSAPVTTDRLISRWLNGLSRQGGTAARLALILPLVGGILLVVQAMVLSHILGRAIVEHAAPATLWLPVAGLGALLAARLAIGAVAETFAVTAAEAVKLTLRQTLSTTLLARPPTWTAARSSGALSSLMVEQVEALDGFLVRYLPAMLQSAILPIAFAAVALSVDWMVGLIFLITAPLIPLFMALAGWGAEAASKQQATALSRLSGRFADRLRGLTTLKLFGREAIEVAGVRSASEELRVRTMVVMRIAFLSSAVLEFFAALGVAGVALYIGLTFLDLISLRGGELSFAAGMFCLLLAPEVYQPLRLLAANYHDRAGAKAAAAEMLAQLEALPIPAPIPSSAGAIAATASGPASLRLVGVCMNTPTGARVIDRLGLDLTAGARIAIVGQSGIGKSTLLEGIARLREFSGDIAIDGIPLGDIPESILRERVGMLSQRPRIFAGTIADNIRLGRATACDTAVAMAAQRACVTEFANALPDGLHSVIGDNGLGLSGGEVQRIALARLYLRNPGLLLLDEPTAHLDVATESRVLDGLLDFARGRTLLVVTHSANVAARMNRVYRLAGGGLLPALRPIFHDQQRGAA